MDNSLPTPTLDLQPEASLGYRIWLLRHEWTRRVELALAPTGLTHMQYFMLRMIEAAPRQGCVPSQARLAEALRVDRMTVSNVVRTLEAKQAVRRGTHPADPRANSVELTEAGFELAKEATRLVFAEHDRFFGRLGPEAMAQFSSMVDELLEGTDRFCAGSRRETR